jgi:methylmalonyl-CoA/ethylmalonyl-CoA epimerase
VTAGVSDTGIGSRIQRLDHVAIAVDDMPAAGTLFIDLLGGRFLNGGDNLESGARIVHLEVGGATVELMQPLREDSVLARHIGRRGTGFHHLTFVVDDLPQTITALDGLGVRVVGTQLEPSHLRETFLSRRDTFGALLQLVDTDLDWHTPAGEYDFDDVLAARVEWVEAVACLR